MQYRSLVMSEQAAPAVIRELGALGCVQFTDMNPHVTPFQRRFVSHLKRYMKLESQIKYVHQEMLGFNDIDVTPVAEDGGIDTGNMGLESHVSLLEDLEGALTKAEDALKELGEYGKKLQTNLQVAIDFDSVMVAIRSVFASQLPVMESESSLAVSSSASDSIKGSELEMTSLLGDQERGGGVQDLSFTRLYGVMNQTEKANFERMVYRATRGNCLMRFADAEGSEGDRTVFMCMYQSPIIDKKVRRICDSINSRTYSMEDLEDPRKSHKLENTNKGTIKDLRILLGRNEESRRDLCVDAALHLEEWLWMVRREKSIYHNMNMMKADIGHLLRGQVWVLECQVDAARSAIKRAHDSLHLKTTTIFEPVRKHWPLEPTHFVTNKYTEAFQEFVNTYGIPRYGEINPALFTTATFPFLFGMMYGDIGHGMCLVIVGLLMILTEEKANARGTGEMLKGIYMGRYMFFMMGVCAVYAGVIYNDFFSLGLDLFGSKWDFEKHEASAKAVNSGDYGDSSNVYSFGADPAWKISENELLFFNSMKMKMSVILGITQMIFGVFLRGANSIYFNNYVDLVCDFVPMLLFAVSFFGYMIVLIFTKWTINWDERMAMGTCGYDEDGIFGGCNLKDSETCFTFSGDSCKAGDSLVDMCPLDYGGTGDGCQPPNLITTLINIALQPGNCAEPMFEGQAALQSNILMVAGISVPWLLLAKPLYLNHLEKAKVAEKKAYTEIPDSDSSPLLGAISDSDDSVADRHGGGGSHGHGHGEFNFSEVFIHQSIETIEFVLGMVSNTASYLRLWALSLAHTELAGVFWEKAMLTTIKMNSPFAIFLGYSVFAMVTTGVLLCMDVLECFLHALRLHWVEFQNKFFSADGVKFAPYSTKEILKGCVLDGA
jgi:V-type H+-transporting ATPase subunit a